VAITICAASVPLLRVLIREVRSLTRQRYGYIVQPGDGGGGGGGGVGSAPDDDAHKRDASSSSEGLSHEKGHRWTLDFSRDSYRGAAFEATSSQRPKDNTLKPPPPAAAGGKILRVSEFELRYHHQQQRQQEKGDDDETTAVRSMV
jgi:hypothetical protein